MPSPKLFAVICAAALAGVTLFAAGSFPQSTPVEYTVEATFPAPGPRPQDIAWDGANLWVVDDSTDVIYRLDPKDCSVLQTFPAPDGNTQGLTWHDGILWACGADSLTVYRVDPDTGEVLETIPVIYGNAPAISSQFHGTGIAFMGDQFFVCFQAHMSSMVASVDLEKRTWDVHYYTSTTDPMGLTYAEKYLWCSEGVRSLHQGFIEGNYHADRRELIKYKYVEYVNGEKPSGIFFDGQCYWLTDNRDRTITRIRLKDISPVVTEDIPITFELLPNFPNPFNASTIIPYSIGMRTHVTIKIYSAHGQEIATLTDGVHKPGRYSALWSGKDYNGHAVGSGSYICILFAGAKQLSQKLTYVK